MLSSTRKGTQLRPSMKARLYIHTHTHIHVCVCVCVCERERERERESVDHLWWPGYRVRLHPHHKPQINPFGSCTAFGIWERESQVYYIYLYTWPSLSCAAFALCSLQHYSLLTNCGMIFFIPDSYNLWFMAALSMWERNQLSNTRAHAHTQQKKPKSLNLNRVRQNADSWLAAMSWRYGLGIGFVL